ncbi:MAG: GGDEF domain-containing phosphodiesterase [Pseudomonadota bacterium]
MVGLDSTWRAASPNRIGEQRFASLPAGTFRFEARARFRNGPWSEPFPSPALRIPAPVWTTTWFRLSAGAAIAGAVALLVVARRLRYRQIYIDRATGLRNRPGFLLLLERRLFRARRSEAPLTVLLIEPDRLDLIAGSLGEGAAEAVLGAVVGRIAPTLGPGEVLGRVGPNQLALATETTGDVAAAQHRAENLLLQLVQPVRVDGHEIFVDASIGLVAGLEGYRSGADMLSDALTARNRARAHGPGTVTSFDPSMRDLARDRLRRQSEFRRALERREIVAAYQPIFDLASGEVVALEALARWQHPTEGLLTPDRFLDVAEDLGLLGALDGQVMEHASSTLQRWRAAKLVGEGPITLHANVSPLELGSAQSRDRIDRASRRLGEHDNLLLEITEHHLLDRSEATFDQMHQLRQLGIAFGIDDFGAGHSSLGYLQDLPVDALKLDRLFVTRLATRGRGIEILSRIIELGRDLGVLVIAEGIETQTQLEELRALGCPAVQGYLLCRPFLEADLIAAGGLAHLVMRPDPSSTETPG